MRVIAGALAGVALLLVGVVLFLWPNPDEERPAEPLALFVEDLSVGEPLHLPGVWVIRLNEREFRAYYDRDPSWTRPLEWYPTGSGGYEARWTAENPPGVFREGCGGSTYDVTGQPVFGPTGFALSEFLVRREGDVVYVNTGRAECRGLRV